MRCLKMRSKCRIRKRCMLRYLLIFVAMAMLSSFLNTLSTLLQHYMHGLRCDAFTCYSYNEATVESPAGPVGNLAFLVNAPGICKWYSGSREFNKLAVVVISKVDNFYRRNIIRKTWASNHGNFRSIVVFLVGTTKNIATQRYLLMEAKRYGDVIQVNVIDHYKLLTYKTIAMVQWFYRHCSDADFYLKVDDDVYVFLENWIRALKKIRQEKVTQNTLFLCSIHNNTKAIRDMKSKWYVSTEQYNGEYYPVYCSGGAYLFSFNVLTILHKTVLTTKVFAIEDVFVSGLAVAGQNITYVNANIVLEKPYRMGCDAMGWLAVHSLTPAKFLSVHSFYSQNKLRCAPGSSVEIH